MNVDLFESYEGAMARCTAPPHRHDSVSAGIYSTVYGVDKMYSGCRSNIENEVIETHRRKSRSCV